MCFEFVRNPRWDLLIGAGGVQRAGEEIRTPDVQLGKLAFYH
jgi:hypothetical protein